MLTWLEPAEIDVPQALQEALGGHPLVARVLARRGITTPDAAQAFLDPWRYTLTAPEDFPGMQTACERIEQALARAERIWVWGDFDVDGQTSTTLLVSALRSLGADPRYHIPVRASESHGVNIPFLKQILASGADLLLTCDTGITAHEALAYAQDNALDVIVTDHHALVETLPPALACLTPRLLPADHPAATLPGVGMAYKLAEALFRRAGRAADVAPLLDLVALGIVSDIAIQSGDARCLLQKGLEVLRHTERSGLQAIMELAQVNPAWLSEEHIGFAIGPRLNALGRLDDANPAVELLTTRDPGRARILATHLEALNAQRQLLTSQVLKAAIAQIDHDSSLLDPPVLILAHPEWPAGVVGIVASELTERFNRPTLLLCTPNGQPARGSARSVEGIDITACIATQSDLLLSFGGHPMAAGLSLNSDRLPALRRGLARAVQQAIDAAPVAPVQSLPIDGFLGLDEFSLDLVADLERLAPFGPGNPPLALAVRDVAVVSTAEIGRGKEHLQLIVEDRAGTRQKVVWWGGAAWPQPQGRFDLACTLRTSNFRGQRELQVQFLDFRPLAEPSADLPRALEILDQRSAVHPRPILDALLAQPDTLVWAEGAALDKIPALDRSALHPATTLIIWTIPPGRSELRAALDAVRPQRVVLFASTPEGDTPEEFLVRLAGLAKYALTHPLAGTPLSLEQLAGLTAQRETTLRLGLDWLAARGQICYNLDGGSLSITAGSGQTESPDVSAGLLAQIKYLLSETAAYRRYFASAGAASLGLEEKTE